MNQKLGGKKSRSRDAILLGETRCIYCGNPPTSLEHMPPRTMFRAKSRPSGMEFASCTECNNGTSSADLVASFLAMIERGNDATSWRLEDIKVKQQALHRKAPGFLEELLHPDKNRETFMRTKGIITPRIEVTVDGPLSRAYLNVFAAKMGMALYREHVGEPLPLDGIVNTTWFTNAGLSNDTAHAMLQMLPIGGGLRQGAFTSAGQFGYRYNSNERDIVAALVGFQAGLHVFLFATGTPSVYPIPSDMFNTQRVTKPGELVSMMPKVGVLLDGHFRGVR